MPKYEGPGAAPPAAEARIGYARRHSDTTITSDVATRAAWGEPSPVAHWPLTLAVVTWRPLVKSALRGVTTVALPIGLKIVDCPVLVSNGRAWVSLPSRPVLHRDGQHKSDANGKPTYAAILERHSRGLNDRFSEAIIAAICQKHPGALDGAEP